MHATASKRSALRESCATGTSERAELLSVRELRTDNKHQYALIDYKLTTQWRDYRRVTLPTKAA